MLLILVCTRATVEESSHRWSNPTVNEKMLALIENYDDDDDDDDDDDISVLGEPALCFLQAFLTEESYS
ncbi:hypothetical protein E2C01_055079 [Portunus trituberculatus]|uniref:Uncharacterized protein n=1 Tax=Portunus trituberculatus TaxID=210409 RepID=A0A5B7GUZ5_PORTR|nr:hypothetical protein [Portunus trituberculatus]